MESRRQENLKPSMIYEGWGLANVDGEALAFCCDIRRFYRLCEFFRNGDLCSYGGIRSVGGGWSFF